MKKLLLMCVIFNFLQLNAQKTYLKIKTNPNNSNVIMYPPGTQFELRDSSNKLVFKYSEIPKKITINSAHTLTVYPEYKDDSDIFKIETGSVELAPTIYFTDSSSHIAANSGTSRLNSEKILTKSTQNNGLFNLVFKLENGIIFTYTDGDYSASLNNKNLKIESKYLIYSDLGILKLSFNPRNGVVWWIFENAEK